MNNGYFFKLRHNHNLLKGHVLFSYTGIKSDKGEVHPLYLDFRNELIAFYFHGQIKKKGKENRPEFIENHLFSLNLHKGKENVLKLNEFLKKLYDSKFPLVKNAVIYKGENQRYAHHNHKTYGDLKVFQSKEKEIKGKKGNATTENKNTGDETGEKILYKTLILDFLFDVYHSNVFENSPAFTQIKQHLDEIPFVQAIKRKAEFYYQMENNEVEKKLVTFDSSNTHYIDNLTNAQKNWLEILQEEGAHKIIYKKNRWFEDVETEVKDTFVKQLKIERLKFIKKNSYRKLWKSYHKFLFTQKSKSTEWFIKRNNVIDSWSLSTITKYFGLFIFFLIDILILGIVLQIERETYDSSFFLIISPLLKISLVVFTIALFYTIIKNLSIFGILLKRVALISVGFTMISFLILLLTSAFLSSELTSYGNKYLILINELSYHGVLLPFFLLIINLIAFLLLCYFIFYYFKNINANSFKFKRVVIKLLILLAGIVSFILFFNNLKKIPIVILFANATHNTLVNLIVLYTNILNIISSHIFWNVFIFSIILLSIIVYVLYNDERKSHPNLYILTSLKKVFTLLLIGLMFSFFANLLIVNYEYKDFLDKYSLIDEIWKNAFDKTDSIPYVREETFSKLKFNTSHVSDSVKIKKLIFEKESSHVDAEKEEYYYLPLEQLKITKIKNGKEFYPVLKRINVLGFEIITLPSVLFINTLLTLLLAVLIQVVLNHKKFLEGGKA